MPLIEVNRTKSDLDDDEVQGDTLLDTSERNNMASTNSMIPPNTTQSEVCNTCILPSTDGTS